MVLIGLISILMAILVFILPFINVPLHFVLATLAIFMCAALMLFGLNVEFTATVLVLLVLGAFIVLIVFTMFVLNQHNTLSYVIKNKSWGFVFLYLVIIFKLTILFSSVPSLGVTQLTITHQLFETRAFIPLFDLSATNSYAIMLLLIGLLLFLLTVGISVLLKSK